jgi:hypothetical protein
MAVSRSSSSDPAWAIVRNKAQLSFGSLKASVDVSRVEQGLVLASLDGRPVAGRLLALKAIQPATPDDEPGEVELGSPDEAYVRGAELWCCYAERDDRPYNIQATWRAVAVAEAELAVDLVVSINTRQWRLRPGVVVSSSLTGVGGEPSLPTKDRAQFAWTRTLCDGWQYGEFPRPGDFAARPTIAAESSKWLFRSDFLERGVIRRLQIRGVFAQSQKCAVDWAERQARLADEPPPLSA